MTDDPICGYCVEPIRTHSPDELTACLLALSSGARPLVPGPDLPALGALLARLIADGALDFWLLAGAAYLTVGASTFHTHSLDLANTTKWTHTIAAGATISADEFALLAASVAAIHVSGGAS